MQWLDRLPKKVRIKCTERISRLAELGNELRRPEADFLRDGVYELRVGYQGVNYRTLNFFYGRAVVVLSHGLMKEREVPNKEIDRAIAYKQQVEADFSRYTFSPAKNAKKCAFASSTVQFLYDRYVGDDEQSTEEYEQEVLNAEVARKIYKFRTRAGLSQRELAKHVGTSASAICRLEDADYDRHSLSLLKQIAEALGNRVEIRFVPVKRRLTA